QPLVVESAKQPYVILVVGVTGVGKTTTIGKRAKKLQGEGKKVMLAAGDTSRAAAAEQLQVWGERSSIGVIAQHPCADSASVIFALAKQFGLPIRYIGVGEGIDDLRTFVAEDFVQALFAEKEQG